MLFTKKFKIIDYDDHHQSVRTGLAIWKVDTGEKVQENDFTYMETTYKLTFKDIQRLILSETNKRDPYYIGILNDDSNHFSIMHPKAGTLRWVDELFEDC